MRSAIPMISCLFAIEVDAFINRFGASVLTRNQLNRSIAHVYPTISSPPPPGRQHSMHRIHRTSFLHKLQKTSDPNSNGSNEISNKQKAEVVMYRITLISASTAYACGQLSNLLLGAGAGLSIDYITSVQQTSHSIVGWGIVSAALLAPPYLGASTDPNKKNDVSNALFLLLNELLPTLAGFAIIVEIVNVIQSNLSEGNVEFISSTSDSLGNTTTIFISLICLREIGFFGAGYKAEAILAIFFCIALGLNDSLEFSELALTSGLALSLLVLSFAKVFEPLEDDLEPNQSAFFMDDQ
eukprot:scaffold513_cov262-Chaetoceros_neogracile.AAC.16